MHSEPKIDIGEKSPEPELKMNPVYSVSVDVADKKIDSTAPTYPRIASVPYSTSECDEKVSSFQASPVHIKYGTAELEQIPTTQNLPKPPLSPSDGSDILYDKAHKNEIVEGGLGYLGTSNTTNGADEYTSSTSCEYDDNVLLDINNETAGQHNDNKHDDDNDDDKEESVDINLAPDDEYKEDSDQSNETVLTIPVNSVPTPAQVPDTMEAIVKAYYAKNQKEN